MYAFTYARPHTQSEAQVLAQAGGKLLAGGQTLLASMKLRLAAPEQVVDLGAIGELKGIRQEGARIVIGAMTCHADVAESALVQSALPVLAQVASGIGDKQVRARGTIGGSIANNDPAADYPAALLGLGATVHTNARDISADDFFQGLFETALQDGELITSVSFSAPQKAAYVKFRQPASLFALVGVFVAQTAGGVRVAVTGTGNGVFRHADMEAALSAHFSPAAVAGVVTDAADMSSDLHASSDYRAHLVGVMTQRAVAQALA